VLRLNREVFDAIRAHGEETYPHECCGALLGRATANGWWIETSVKAANTRTDSAHNRYQIAQWSETDLTEAHWLGCSYVITAVAQGNATETNAFLLAGDAEESKRFEAESIELQE
jgi:proteasome lid subunit RPN8/RPN11